VKRGQGKDPMHYGERDIAQSMHNSLRSSPSIAKQILEQPETTALGDR
jgi:hypothetical protein